MPTLDKGSSSMIVNKCRFGSLLVSKIPSPPLIQKTNLFPWSRSNLTSPDVQFGWSHGYHAIKWNRNKSYIWELKQLELGLLVKWLSWWLPRENFQVLTNHWHFEILIYHPHLCLDGKKSSHMLEFLYPTFACIQFETFSYRICTHWTDDHPLISRKHNANHYNK